jgi:hypothetical protein
LEPGGESLGRGTERRREERAMAMEKDWGSDVVRVRAGSVLSSNLLWQSCLMKVTFFMMMILSSSISDI